VIEEAIARAGLQSQRKKIENNEMNLWNAQRQELVALIALPSHAAFYSYKDSTSTKLLLSFTFFMKI
jgi:hypothetical protein